MNENIKIETERLILRQWTLDDIDAIIDGLNNLNVSKWLANVVYPFTKEDAVIFINDSIERNKYSFAIVLKEENKVIGGTNISDIDYVNGSAGGGIWINEKYQRQGYGTEAFGARIKYAFEILGLRRLENGYLEGDEHFHRILLKYGYKDEGKIRERFISQSTGKIEDEYITGLLWNEWIKDGTEVL